MTSLRPVEVIRGADLHRLVGLEFDRHSLDRNLRLLDELADFGGGHLNAVFHGVIPDQDVAEYGPKHVTLSQFQKVRKTRALKKKSPYIRVSTPFFVYLAEREALRRFHLSESFFLFFNNNTMMNLLTYYDEQCQVLAHIQSRRLKIVTLSELLELSKCSPDLSSSQSASIN